MPTAIIGTCLSQQFISLSLLSNVDANPKFVILLPVINLHKDCTSKSAIQLKFERPSNSSIREKPLETTAHTPY